MAWLDAEVGPGKVFLDIGANVGSYTLIAASSGATCIAVEPMFANYGKLGKNLALNNLLGSTLKLAGAIGAQPGPQEFHIQDMQPGSASHILGTAGAAKVTWHTEPVMVWTMDQLLSLCGDVPRHIKIDTDGNEQDVIKGMAATLAEPNTQSVMMEYRLKDEEQTQAFFAQHGWRQAEKFDEREGKKIGDIAYGLFRRAI